MTQQAMVRHTPVDLVRQRMDTMIRSLPQKPSFINRWKQAAISIACSPGINDCSPESVARSIYVCARLGLIPDPIQQQVYIVGFRNHGVKEATVIVGYKGLIALAKNSDPGMEIRVGTVYSNDDYEYETGLQTIFRITKLWWQKGLEVPGDPVFHYCVSKQGGATDPSVHVVSAVECRRIGARSKAGNRPGSPWHDNYVAMAEKTAIRQASRLWRLDPDRDDTVKFRQAVALDENTDGEPMPADSTDILGDLTEDAMSSGATPTPPAGEHSATNVPPAPAASKAGPRKAAPYPNPVAPPAPLVGEQAQAAAVSRVNPCKTQVLEAAAERIVKAGLPGTIGQCLGLLSAVLGMNETAEVEYTLNFIKPAAVDQIISNISDTSNAAIAELLKGIS